MEKIKDALHIGHKKEHGSADGVTTGTTGTDGRKGSITAEIATSEETAAQRAADHNPHESRHLIARQLFNPGGDKYNAEQYGTPADGIPVPSSQLEAETLEQRKQSTQHGESAHLVARQILNPGGDKYNPEQYGTLADSQTSAHAAGSSTTGTTANTTSQTDRVV